MTGIRGPPTNSDMGEFGLLSQSKSTWEMSHILDHNRLENTFHTSSPLPYQTSQSIVTLCLQAAFFKNKLFWHSLKIRKQKAD